MIAVGLFDEDEHLELIDGRVVETTTQGSRHATAVLLVRAMRLTAVFAPGFLERGPRCRSRWTTAPSLSPM